jgi:hypothetical protein
MAWRELINGSFYEFWNFGSNIKVSKFTLKWGEGDPSYTEFTAIKENWW